ncbi:autophagy protein [Pleurotus ostreatus]|nr:autophagy protein [Pleurotus ostreatus]
MIGELLFPLSILAVRMNQRALVIVLEAEIYIYDISTMRLLHVIETTANPEAINPCSFPECGGVVSPFSIAITVTKFSAIYPICDAAAASSPAPQSNGDVAIFSTTPITTANIIPLAHKSPLDRSNLPERLAAYYGLGQGHGDPCIKCTESGEVVSVQMVHLFKLGERTTAASTATSVIATGSIERRDRPMDGGDEAYLDERKKGRGNGVP